MAKNITRVTLQHNQNWVAPGGVTSVILRTYNNNLWPNPTGSNSSVLRQVDGSAYSWGTGTDGQLGNNAAVNKSSPVAVVGGLKFKQVSGGLSHQLGLTETGELYAWGLNAYGELGDGTVTKRSSPVLVSGGLKFVTCAAGSLFSGAISTLGDAYMWGANSGSLIGCLGDGTNTDRSAPTLVVGGLKWKSISLGLDCTAGTDAYGRAWTWGTNQYGQLAHNNVTYISSPVLVTTLPTVSKVRNVVAGDDVIYFVLEDDSVYSCGSSAFGSLGNGTYAFSDVSVPVAVLGSHKFKQISAGYLGAMGIDTSGAAWGWGYNLKGGLGNNAATTQESSPVAVVGGIKFKQIIGGRGFSVGVDETGVAYAWGSNDNGELGDGTVVGKSSPILVIGSKLFQPQEPFSQVVSLTVIPGTTYAVSFDGGILTFGGTVVDTGCYRLDMQYFS